MAEKKAPEGAPRPKREAPTIDLTAKDVTPPTAAPEPPPADAAANDAVNAAPPEPPTTPPPEQPATAEAAPGSGAVRGTNWLTLIAAGIAGGLIVTAALAAAWYGDILPTPQPMTRGTNAQLAILQKQIHDLESRPAPGVDTKSVDALTQRVAKMEDALKNAPKSGGDVADRLGAAESAMKSLGVALAALNQRTDDSSADAARAREQAEAAEKAVTQLRGSVQDVARGATSAVAPEQIDALRQRLSSLEQAGKAARGELDKMVAGEKVTRLALSAAALRDVVTSGRPFNAELVQAKALGAGDKYLTVLSPFAASGLPSATALTQELRALLPRMEKTSGATSSGSFLDRLEANASKLVKVTPVDVPPGDDASAVLSRLEVEAAHVDIAGGLADLAKLPEATRAPAQGWIAKAKAREAALAAARDLAADTSRALAQR